MHAIPTLYAGVQFRSRLEAKWGAFFDQFGWAWQYEPMDFAGWIPDFCVYIHRTPTLVEIKPITPDLERPSDLELKARADIERAAHSIDRYSYMFGLFGIGPLPPDRAGGWGKTLGLAYRDPQWGPFTFPDRGRTHDDLSAMWATASNITQWKPPR